MKIAVNRWTMPGDWDVSRCLDEAVSAGFEGIEFNMSETGPLSVDSAEGEWRGLSDAAAGAGVELTSLSCGLGWAYPLTSEKPEVRDRGMAILRAELQAAAWMGVDAVLCVPGVVTPDVPYDTAYERAQSALRSAAEFAGSVGVRIGVENVWNRFLLSPLEMARFVDEIGSEWVRAYFDAGNVLQTGYPQHWVRVLGERIVRLHVKDFRGSVGNIGGFCNILQGDLDWGALKASLTKVCYDGWVIAEVDGYPRAPETGLRHITESLRLALA